MRGLHFAARLCSLVAERWFELAVDGIAEVPVVRTRVVVGSGRDWLLSVIGLVCNPCELRVSVGSLEDERSGRAIDCDGENELLSSEGR